MEKDYFSFKFPEKKKEILAKANIDFTTVKSNYEEESFKFYNESFIKRIHYIKLLMLQDV